MARSILVTGGNAGIGLALCRQLAVDHKDKVDKIYMGSRSAARGEEGLKSIVSKYPDCASRVELVVIDV